MRHITDYESLTNPDKAAVMFLCLGEKRGTQIVEHLNDSEIHAVMSSMSNLGAVSKDVVERVLDEFEATLNSGGAVFGSADDAERILSSIFPADKVNEFLSEVRGPISGQSLWESFARFPEKTIVSYLEDEHDQLAATVLSRVPPEVAARVLPLLDQKRAADIAERMITMDPVPRPMLEAIESTVAQEFLANSARRGSDDTPKRMADIFNKMDPATFEQIERTLEGRNPKAVEEIRQKMFTFDDLVRLDQESLGMVLMAARDPSHVPLALKAVDQEKRQIFLDAVPRLSRQALEEEMRRPTKVRARDATNAQNALVDLALEMARNDKIQMPIEDDELL
mgnify:CR=1 FL=1